MRFEIMLVIVPSRDSEMAICQTHWTPDGPKPTDTDPVSIGDLLTQRWKCVGVTTARAGLVFAMQRPYQGGQSSVADAWST